MVSEELYDRLMELTEAEEGQTPSVAAVFDTKLPDHYQHGPVPTLVLQSISDVPTTKTIEGKIAIRHSLWQVSIYALDIHAARQTKEAVRAKLHGYRGTLIRWCDFEDAPGEMFESDWNPPLYHVPLDFTVTQ